MSKSESNIGNEPFWIGGATGGIFLPDTPNSLVERGHIERGRAVLRRVRGTRDVDVEFSSILIANKAAQHTENPWRSIGRWGVTEYYLLRSGRLGGLAPHTQ